MLRVAACLAVGFATVAPSAAHSQGRPGLTFPPYPGGVEWQSGTAIPASNGGGDYGIDWVTASSKDQLWFSRLLRRSRKGEAVWAIVDTLTVPSYDSTASLVISQCSLHGRFDPEVLAVAVDSNADSLRTVLAAWRADRRTNHFVAIPTKGIVCANEAYGDE